MGIYEELQARGLIAQVTDEPEIRELINNGGARFYIGFDPTADSLPSSLNVSFPLPTFNKIKLASFRFSSNCMV